MAPPAGAVSEGLPPLPPLVASSRPPSAGAEPRPAATPPARATPARRSARSHSEYPGDGSRPASGGVLASTLGSGGFGGSRSSRPPSALRGRPGSAGSRPGSAGSAGRAASASRAAALQEEARREVKAVFRQDPAWLEVYDACSSPGAQQAPERARLFLEAVRAQNRGAQEDRLALRGLRLGALAVSALATQLHGREYTRLDLSNSVLGDGAGPHLRRLLAALPHLRRLSLANCGLQPEATGELARELASGSALEVLELGSAEASCAQPAGRRAAVTEAPAGRPNVVGDAGLRQLLEGLRKSPAPALTSLSLCGTSLTAEAARCLAEGLGPGGPLQHLDLSSNRLASEGLCALLPQCRHLRSLGLADTGLQGEAAVSRLLELLRGPQDTSLEFGSSGTALEFGNKCLARLSLGRNPLGPESLGHLAGALAGCEALASLNLEATSMDAETAVVLAEALMAPHAPPISELDLSCNELADAGASAAVALACLARRGVLQVLRLNSTALGDAGARELASALDPEDCFAGGLRHLEVAGCRITADGAVRLLEALAGNEKLRVLSLADNFLDDRLDVQLVERCRCLQELQLSGNRLSQGHLGRAAQATARNRDLARHGSTYALRSEVHRLLFQEVKVGQHRQQLDRDGAEITHRRTATEEASQELRQLRLSGEEARAQLGQRICESQEELEAKRRELVQSQVALEESSQRFASLQKDLRAELRESEQNLRECRAEALALEEKLRDRKEQHPLEVAAVRERIRAAEADTERLHESAAQFRLRLRELQGQSLLDLRP